MYLGDYSSCWCCRDNGLTLCACASAHGQSLVCRWQQGQAAPTSLFARQCLQQPFLFGHHQSSRGGPQQWMWGLPASVPLHGQRQPEQDATTPTKPCDTGQDKRRSGAIHGVLQLPSVHFRTSEESTRGRKARHPNFAGLRGYGGESQIHGIISIKTSD